VRRGTRSASAEARLVDAIEHRLHAPVGGERIEQRTGDAAIGVAVERALEQAIPQEHEREKRRIFFFAPRIPPILYCLGRLTALLLYRTISRIPAGDRLDFRKDFEVYGSSSQSA
jgi:hypothetical protein